MKAGTIIRLPDGREGTVVYNGLDGYGIKWGHHDVSMRDMEGSDGNTMNFLGGNSIEPPQGYQLFPDAMLRDPYPSASLPCVGEEFEVVAERRL